MLTQNRHETNTPGTLLPPGDFAKKHTAGPVKDMAGVRKDRDSGPPRTARAWVVVSGLPQIIEFSRIFPISEE